MSCGTRRHDGKVEGLVKNGRRRFLTPVPVAASFDDLNAKLLADCRADQARCTDRQRETIGARMTADLAAFAPLPAAPFEACEIVPAHISSTSLVRYRCNDYSAPTTRHVEDMLSA